MSKYKVGDKFVVEIKEVLNDELPYDTENLYRIDGFKTLVFDDYGLDKLQKYDEVKERLELIDELKQAEYNRGLQDAWELARRLFGYSCDTKLYAEDLKEIFGSACEMDILRNNTPQQALAKIEAYEKSKQIQVGDVVKVRTGAGSEHLGVVTQITANQNCACIVYADGSTEMNTANNMTKTNKHLDIEHLLEQIRGE